MASPGDAAGRRQATVKAKVVLLGEGAVGKTSLVLRYSENKFNDKHEQTLQVRSFVAGTDVACATFTLETPFFLSLLRRESVCVAVRF